MIILNYKYNSDGGGWPVILAALALVAFAMIIKTLFYSHEVDKTCINNEYYYVYGGEIFKHKGFIGKSCINDEVEVRSPN